MDVEKFVSKFKPKHCIVALAVFALIISTLILLQFYVSTLAVIALGNKSLSPSLPSTANITLVALNGTEYFLNSSQIATLPSITASGGYVPTPGPPYHPNNYTGVALNTLANLVGGLNSSEDLMVEGSDGYDINFTYSQAVNGNFSTLNSTTGVSTLPTKPIAPIVAYYNNSQLIPGKSSNGSGPLMVAIVGNESLITQGRYWVKWVDKIEVFRATSVPEFPAISLVFLFIALTLIAVVASVRLGRKSTKKPFFSQLLVKQENSESKP
jgi:hypothetical protein